jgi:hypothetical protein
MKSDPKNIKLWVQVIITVALGGFSMYLIKTEPPDSVKLKWAFGIVGIVIGYWLK